MYLPIMQCSLSIKRRVDGLQQGRGWWLTAGRDWHVIVAETAVLPSKRGAIPNPRRAFPDKFTSESRQPTVIKHILDWNRKIFIAESGRTVYLKSLFVPPS